MLEFDEFKRILEELSKERPVFHSEADFQFALAWKIQGTYPDSKIRLEKCIDDMYIDIIVKMDGEEVPIELKYKTRNKSKEDKTKKSVPFEDKYGESFNLKNQGAQDQARYDFVKDISRIEDLVINDVNKMNHGYAVILTNDETYWNEPKKGPTNCESFRIHKKELKEGCHDWKSGTSEGTKQGRVSPIILKKQYTLEWSDYSSFEGRNYNDSKFQFLIVEVTKLAQTK